MRQFNSCLMCCVFSAKEVSPGRCWTEIKPVRRIFTRRRGILITRFLSSLTGLFRFLRLNPAINGWAIFREPRAALGSATCPWQLSIVLPKNPHLTLTLSPPIRWERRGKSKLALLVIVAAISHRRFRVQCAKSFRRRAFIRPRSTELSCSWTSVFCPKIFAAFTRPVTSLYPNPDSAQSPSLIPRSRRLPIRLE